MKNVGDVERRRRNLTLNKERYDNIKPLKKVGLIKPLTSGIELTDPDRHDENTISYYIPIWFNPDEYFEGVQVSSAESDNYINLYLIYHCQSDRVELEISYFSCSSFEEKNSEINVVLDKETEAYLRNLLSCEYNMCGNALQS